MMHRLLSVCVAPQSQHRPVPAVCAGVLAGGEVSVQEATPAGYDSGLCGSVLPGAVDGPELCPVPGFCSSDIRGGQPLPSRNISGIRLPRGQRAGLHRKRRCTLCGGIRLVPRRKRAGAGAICEIPFVAARRCKGFVPAARMGKEGPQEPAGLLWHSQAQNHYQRCLLLGQGL